MSPIVYAPLSVVAGAPRVSGDEPKIIQRANYSPACSPRERG